MPKPRFKRAGHQKVIELLSGLDAPLLDRARCYFGGGTRIVLELGEYRESKDIDFLCSDTEGYRVLRQSISDKSLGPIARKRLALAREVRADQYGIRTFLASGGTIIKFEIVLEGRIQVAGEDIVAIPVRSLTRRHCFAEKFLANADRGLDASMLSRDIVDLAFMMQGWSSSDAAAGLATAKGPYGDSIQRSLAAVLKRMREDRSYRNRCIQGLAIEDTRTMAAGLKALEILL